MGMAHHLHQEEPMLLHPLRGLVSEVHVVQVPQGPQHPTDPTCQSAHRVHGKVPVRHQAHHLVHQQGQVQVLAVPSEAEEVVLAVDLVVAVAVAPVAVAAASVEEDNRCTISLIDVSLNLTI